MTVPTFRLRIALPAHHDSAALFRELTGQLVRYVGLEPARAEQAGAVLARLVSDRLDRAAATDEPVHVTFERPDEGGPVTVELTGPGAPGDADIAARGGLVVEQGGEHAPLRLSWPVQG